MFFSFCPECGGSIDQEQVEGQAVVCKHCGKQIGVVTPAPKPTVVDQADELIQSGAAARCPLCRQLVEVRAVQTARTFAAHYASPPQRKLCPNSGKPVPSPVPEPPPPATAPPSAKGPGGKDLSAFLTREVVRVVSCRRAAAPQIEELTLEYLDKADRVRIQIDALREMLGPSFRMSAYPASLHRPGLAVWGNATACVVARKHERGGYQPMNEREITEVVNDLRQHGPQFFT